MSRKMIAVIFVSILLFGCGDGASSDINHSKGAEMFSESKKETYVIFSPMHGMLMKDGQPLPNTKIIRRLRWNGNDEGLVEEFASDENGRFSLPIHEEVLELGLTQFVAKAELEALVGAEHFEFWYSSKLDPEIYTETAGELEDLKCDVNLKENAIPTSPVAILAKCSWKNMPN